MDPLKLRARGVSMAQVVEAVKKSNSEAGGRLLELAGAEYMIRGRGYIRSAADLENIPIAGEGESAVVRVRDVGVVTLGPEMRRGAADWNGARRARLRNHRDARRRQCAGRDPRRKSKAAVKSSPGCPRE